MTSDQPPGGLSTAAVLAHAAMALGRIEEICYSSSRPAAGSKIIEIIGVVTHFKVLTAVDDDQPGDAVGEPPGPFAPRRPNACIEPDAAPDAPGPASGYDPQTGLYSGQFDPGGQIVNPISEPVTVHYVPGREGATDPSCQACGTIHPFGDPCPPAGATALMPTVSRP